MEKALAQQIAERVSDIFPELNGRSIAVSEIQPFKLKSEVPTLPIAVVALINGTGVQSEHGGGRIKLSDTFAVEMIFETERYKADGKTLPFYSFYNYEQVRDRLLSGFRDWTNKCNIGLSYKSIGVESDQFAVYITVTFSVTHDWCDPSPQEPDLILGSKTTQISVRS